MRASAEVRTEDLGSVQAPAPLARGSLKKTVDSPSTSIANRVGHPDLTLKEGKKRSGGMNIWQISRGGRLHDACQLRCFISILTEGDKRGYSINS
jgi:hypothetical protein